MSQQYPGGFITKANVDPTSSFPATPAPGVWTLDQALQYRQAGVWPSYAVNAIEDVFSTYLYTGNGSVQTINNGIAIGSSYGGSIYFNGSTSAANTPYNTALKLTSGDWTLEFWINTPGSASNSGIWQQEFTNSYNGILITCTGVNIYFSSSTSGTAWDYLNQLIGTVVANTWNHVAITKSGSTVRGFLNGNLNLTISSFPSSIYSTVNGGRFGQYSTSYLTGQLSNFRIVKGTALYTSAFTPPTSPLTAVTNTSLLTFQSPSLTTDYSPNAFAITTSAIVEQNGTGPFSDTTANKGGLVWLKKRSAADSHALYDTVRGVNKELSSNTTAAQGNTDRLPAFNSTGFTVASGMNTNADNYASWTFREQEKFFDVVTYTGNNSSQTINHNLGSVPGCIIVKCASSADSWFVYHRSLGTSQYLNLNLTAAASSSSGFWGSVTSTSFGTTAAINANGQTYVAYLFAHDAGGFGPNNTDNVITCGSYTGNGSATGPTITLGYEPQFLIIKNITAAASWFMFDNMRGMPVGYSDPYLLPNTSAAEATGIDYVDPLATGFQLKVANANVNASANTYIYIAVRRGPMRPPTTGTSVFYPLTISQADSIDSTGVPFPPDLINTFSRNGSSRTSAMQLLVVDRLRSAGVPNNTFSASGAGLNTALTDAETAAGAASPYVQLKADSQNITRGTGWNTASYGNWVNYFFRRAPGFFDIVCYTGTGPTSQALTHNLGVKPELIIVKCRSAAGQEWAVQPQSDGTKLLKLNSTAAIATNNAYWNDTNPTATAFTVGPNSGLTNSNGATYVAYLFATLAGVSKVGSYTGTGALQTINCGFASGARFILIKRTDSTGDWYVYDSARGITSGNDPYLLTNSNAVEVTGTNYVDTTSVGFQVTAAAPAGLNANGGTYIFLAIA